MLHKYRAVFSKRPNVYQHIIILTNSKTIVPKSYPVALSQRPPVYEEMSEMKAIDVIEQSDSSHCNPLRVVPQKNVKVRLCLDARLLFLSIYYLIMKVRRE